VIERSAIRTNTLSAVSNLSVLGSQHLVDRASDGLMTGTDIEHCVDRPTVKDSIFKPLSFQESGILDPSPPMTRTLPSTLATQQGPQSALPRTVRRSHPDYPTYTHTHTHSHTESSPVPTLARPLTTVPSRLLSLCQPYLTPTQPNRPPRNTTNNTTNQSKS